MERPLDFNVSLHYTWVCTALGIWLCSLCNIICPHWVTTANTLYCLLKIPCQSIFLPHVNDIHTHIMVKHLRGNHPVSYSIIHTQQGHLHLALMWDIWQPKHVFYPAQQPKQLSPSHVPLLFCLYTFLQFHNLLGVFSISLPPLVSKSTMVCL